MLVKQYLILSSKFYPNVSALKGAFLKVSARQTFNQFLYNNNAAQSTSVYGPLYVAANTYMNDRVMIFFDAGLINIMLN